MSLLSVTLVLSIIVGVCGQELHETDEVSFLHTDMVIRSRKKPTLAQVDADEPVAKDTSCQVMSDSDPTSAAFVQKEEAAFEMPAAPVEELFLNEPGNVQKASPTDTDATSATWTLAASGALGYLLDLLIVAVFWDGFRRWSLKRETEAKSAKRPTNPSSPTSSGDWDSLMSAALAGNVSRCETLLRKGVAMGRADVWGCTVLHAAAKGGSVPLVKMLLERRSGGIDRPDAWDETPLHLAGRAGHVEVCEVLLAHGARINAINAQDWTALVVAADANQEDVCKFLMSRGATIEGLEGDLPPMLMKLMANPLSEADDARDE